jgi:hypothetical protein
MRRKEKEREQSDWLHKQLLAAAEVCSAIRYRKKRYPELAEKAADLWECMIHTYVESFTPRDSASSSSDNRGTCSSEHSP